MNFFKPLIFCFVITFFFLGSDAKTIEKNCNDISFSQGFYVLKYTFVKYTGICYVFHNNQELIEQKSFLNGEKNGRFKTFKNNKIVEDYLMKKNQLHGNYELYKNNKLYKKILYDDGEIINCEVDFSLLINEENELRLWRQKSLNLNLKNEELKVRIENLTKRLNKDKESCTFFD